MVASGGEAAHAGRRHLRASVSGLVAREPRVVRGGARDAGRRRAPAVRFYPGLRHPGGARAGRARGGRASRRAAPARSTGAGLDRGAGGKPAAGAVPLVRSTTVSGPGAAWGLPAYPGRSNLGTIMVVYNAPCSAMNTYPAERLVRGRVRREVKRELLARKLCGEPGAVPRARTAGGRARGRLLAPDAAAVDGQARGRRHRLRLPRPCSTTPKAVACSCLRRTPSIRRPACERYPAWSAIASSGSGRATRRWPTRRWCPTCTGTPTRHGPATARRSTRSATTGWSSTT